MMTTPLAMLVIGATLSVYHLKDIFSDYTVYLFTLLIDLIIPILFYPVILLFIKRFDDTWNYIDYFSNASS